MMTSARQLNDGMGDYVGNQVIKLMNKKGILVKDSNILILGITFKENCPDIRNTKVVDIYHTLREYTPNITIFDPWCNKARVKAVYDLDVMNELPSEKKYDVAVLAVAHNDFKSLDIKEHMNDNSVIYDVKGFLKREETDGRL